MRKFRWLVMLLGAIGMSGLAYAGKAVTQKYEVVCMKCVAHNASMGKNGGHGAGHAACAMSCASKGSDLGLMDEKGNLFIPLNADFSPARDVVKDKAGQTVELTGEVVRTKGVNYLKLSGSDAPASDMKKDDGDKD